MCTLVGIGVLYNMTDSACDVSFAWPLAFCVSVGRTYQCAGYVLPCRSGKELGTISLCLFFYFFYSLWSTLREHRLPSQLPVGMVVQLLKSYDRATTGGEDSVAVNPIKIFHQAIENVKPTVSTYKMKRGGRSYHVSG